MLEGHQEIDILYIGEIEFPNIINENEIGNKNSRYSVKGIGKCKIEVFSGEGSIPHFHITGIANKFNCCVRIHEPFFFSHGNKYRDTLNKQQCKELNEWLKQPNRVDEVDMTNWETIRFGWNLSNPDCRYPKNLKAASQPDYTKMTLFRDSI